MNYLLESSICITVFYVLYYLFFRRLTFIRLNRIYLISSLIIGLILPSISYQLQEVINVVPSNIEREGTTLTPLIMNSHVSPVLNNPPFDWLIIWQACYILGILFMLIRFSIVIYKILTIKRIPTKRGFISTQGKYANSSFFNLIFVDDSNLSISEINQIVEHEKWHIRLLHSYDLLLVEILKIFFWFNPVLWLYQYSLTEVHEYEVDMRMVQTHNPQVYAQLLLKLATSRPVLATTHQFSRKPLTDRIHFLFTKQKNVPMKRLAYLSIIPILVIFFMAFSVEKVVNYRTVPAKYLKVIKGDAIISNSNDLTKISVLKLKKDEVALFIGFDKISKDAIVEASNYFKAYGFTLKVINQEFGSGKKLSKIEISLVEENRVKKREKGVYESSNDGNIYDLNSLRNGNKDKRQFISITANRNTGQHTVMIGEM